MSDRLASGSPPAADRTREVAGGTHYELHILATRLHRIADRVLRTELDMSYRRFLALLLVGEGTPTQRLLAERLGVTEPSTSRMVAVLVSGGWLEVVHHPAGGHRRQLGLTSTGKQRVAAGRDILENRLAHLMERGGGSPADYACHAKYAECTGRLLVALEAGEQRSGTGRPKR